MGAQRSKPARHQTRYIAVVGINKGMRWMRKNLFSTWYNATLTVMILAVMHWAISGAIHWSLSTARWEVIPANLQLLLVGAYPRELTWRLWLVVGGVGLMAVTSSWLWRRRGRTRMWLGIGWLISFPMALLFIHGFGKESAMRVVPTQQWGGLMLTLLLALVSIVLSFPLGVFLALGRRSTLPAISGFCTVVIEIIRGIPLITILFMAQILLPIFVPGVRIDKVVRAMAGLTIFTAAYVAEDVRGGLQAVPQGQEEAAIALGLSGVQVTFLVVLPQALRTVIPALVGQFISVFKDTSLVAIVGLMELLGVARAVIGNPDWLGLQTEVYLFIGFIYFVFCFALSNASQKLEQRLGIGMR